MAEDFSAYVTWNIHKDNRNELILTKTFTYKEHGRIDINYMETMPYLINDMNDNMLDDLKKVIDNEIKRVIEKELREFNKLEEARKTADELEFYRKSRLDTEIASTEPILIIKP